MLGDALPLAPVHIGILRGVPAPSVAPRHLVGSANTTNGEGRQTQPARAHRRRQRQLLSHEPRLRRPIGKPGDRGVALVRG